MRYVFISIASLAISAAAADDRPINGDIVRKLGGAPKVERTQENKPSPEQIEVQRKVEALLPILTDASVNNLADDDPVLTAIYVERLRAGHRIFAPWNEVVDRDIVNRPHAKSILSSILANEPVLDSRSGVLDWLSMHRTIPLGDELLDDAIRFYKKDNKKWEYEEIRGLARLIATFGGENHRHLLDEIQGSGISVGLEKVQLDRRINNEHDKASIPTPDTKSATAASSTMKPALSQPAKDSPASIESNHNRWLVWPILLIVATSGAVWVMMRKAKWSA